MMNKKFLWVAMAAPFILGGCQDKKEVKDLTDKVIKVKTMKVTAEVLSAEKSYSGTVEASSGTALSFPVMGTISRIYVQTGDRVTRGQVIAAVDTVTLRSSYNAAKAALNQAQDAYDRLKVLYEEKSLPEIKWIEIQSKLQQAQAMEMMARKNLRDCKLTAPFTGVIAEKVAEVGQNVAPGVPVVKLVAMQQLKVKVAVPEGDIADIKVGNKAWVRIPAAGNACLEGTVIEKGVVAHPLSRSYEVKVGVDNNKKNALLPGMVTEVNICGENDRSVMVLPAYAVLLDEQNRTFVWVNEQGHAAKRIVKCGEYTAGGVVVVDGLAPGDEVITAGQQKVCGHSAIAL